MFSQVVTFVHSVLTAEERLGLRRVLVLCPNNVILNWMNEFNVWLSRSSNVDQLDLLSKVTCVAREKTPEGRLQTVEKWFNDGGVLIMGYDLFRLLASAESIHAAKVHQYYLTQNVEGVKPPKVQLSEDQRRSLASYLLRPGPDLVVCDEGHLLKNEETKLFKCLNSVRTRRRVVLTGTPLQNNLKEYHCMVQFVKPNLLGTLKEFTNR